MISPGKPAPEGRLSVHSPGALIALRFCPALCSFSLRPLTLSSATAITTTLPPLLDCMYPQLRSRQHQILTQFVQYLSDHSAEMALDSRFFAIDHGNGHGNGPTSNSSVSSSGVSNTTGITSPSTLSTSASAANLRSTASSPSLRARESVAVPVVRQDASSPGGNVRVVVRVRNFLPRGGFGSLDLGACGWLT